MVQIANGIWRRWSIAKHSGLNPHSTTAVWVGGLNMEPIFGDKKHDLQIEYADIYLEHIDPNPETTPLILVRILVVKLIPGKPEIRAHDNGGTYQWPEKTLWLGLDQRNRLANWADLEEGVDHLLTEWAKQLA